ncbi:MAG: hypothetical protein IJD21_06710 [Oscillospiraceae bacterium]|nr:hypothetical protein [Oscillospiraceae bacterium]
MERLDRKLLLASAVTVVLGIGLHFLFDVWPSILTEFIAPVNESLWEHIKIFFWPYLIVGLYLTGEGKWSRAPWLASMILLCVLLLAGGWFIHWKLGGGLALNLAWYLILMGLGFWLPVKWKVADWWTEGLTCVVIILIGLIICWTIDPPEMDLFRDLTLQDTFCPLPV